jgi:dTDP-4-dehydrorhamnose reductase
MTPRPRVLLLGGTGRVGWELCRALAPIATVAAPPRGSLDLDDAATLRERVVALRPAAIVNAAAFTAVDGAEAEAEAAWRTNALAPGLLAEAAAGLGVPLLHLSTDYVFDGAAGRSYREDDHAAPLGVYGATKLEGERRVAAAGSAHLILRIAWVYGARGGGFLRTVRDRWRAGETLRVVADQRGAPTWSRMVACAVAALLARIADGDAFALPAGTEGVYHLGSGGSTTWHGFARAIVGAPEGDARIVPIGSAERAAAARRPASSLLDSTRIARVFGVALPHWRDQLALFLEEDAASG